jgi:hypothetical protein
MGFLMNMNMKRRRDSGNAVGDVSIWGLGGFMRGVVLWIYGGNNGMRALEQISWGREHSSTGCYIDSGVREPMRSQILNSFMLCYGQIS